MRDETPSAWRDSTYIRNRSHRRPGCTRVRRRHGFSWSAALARSFSDCCRGVAAAPACYDEGDGTDPPTDSLYFPVGLQVSHGGTALYVINADFDLQYNGGTLQAYDLRSMRQDALKAIINPTDPSLPLLRPAAPGCPSDPPVLRTDGTQTRQTLARRCSPPVNSVTYFRDSAIIGAFATDLLMSPLPSELIVQATKFHAQDPTPTAVETQNDRLFAPVRGNATLTWADVVRDDFTSTPDAKTSTKDNYPPFKISCGQDSTSRCDHAHAVVKTRRSRAIHATFCCPASRSASRSARTAPRSS